MLRGADPSDAQALSLDGGALSVARVAGDRCVRCCVRTVRRLRLVGRPRARVHDVAAPMFVDDGDGQGGGGPDPTKSAYEVERATFDAA